MGNITEAKKLGEVSNIISKMYRYSNAELGVKEHTPSPSLSSDSEILRSDSDSNPDTDFEKAVKASLKDNSFGSKNGSSSKN